VCITRFIRHEKGPDKLDSTFCYLVSLG